MTTEAVFPVLHGGQTGAVTPPASQELPHRRSLSPEIVADVAKFADICLITGTGSVFYYRLLAAAPHSAAVTADGDIFIILATAFGFVALFQRLGGYAAKQLLLVRSQLISTASSWLSTTAALMGMMVVLSLLAPVPGLLRAGTMPVVGWIGTILVLLLIQRYAIVCLVAAGIRQGILVRNVVVVGAGSPVQQLVKKLKGTADPSVVVRGVFCDRDLAVPAIVEGCRVLGTTDDLLHFARRVPVDEIIIALPLDATGEINDLIEKLSSLPTDLCISAEPIMNTLPVRSVSQIERIVLLGIAHQPLKSWSAVTKWVEDKVLAAVFLLLAAPAMLLIALLIKLESRGPVLFVQDRFGFNNNVIRVFKFRTMYADRGDQSGRQRTVRDDPRVTRAGRILRALSLDELPQLLNVLRGDMSLIGPRAHPVAMMAGTRLYSEAVKQYAHRHRIKPGITGWAQVHGNRGEIDTVEKAQARVAYDLAYIERWSLWLDLKILAMTVRQLLSRQNAY